jgi:chemotaxis protein MotB
MFRAEPSLENSYGEYFASSAYSEFRPVEQGKTEASFQQNRRIEISVVLKDAGIRSVIDEYMKNQVPIETEGAP